MNFSKKRKKKAYHDSRKTHPRSRPRHILHEGVAEGAECIAVFVSENNVIVGEGGSVAVIVYVYVDVTDSDGDVVVGDG